MDGGSPVEAVCAADQADRVLVQGAPARPWAEVQRNDALRRAAIRDAEARGLLVTADALACAALIFQHGEALADIEQARRFALEAVKLEPTHARARRLVALTTDRALMRRGLPQKFGTQSFKNDAGVFERWPVDPLTTDAERAEWGVASLPGVRTVDAGIAKP
jgi:hypothetical protein